MVAINEETVLCDGKPEQAPGGDETDRPLRRLEIIEEALLKEDVLEFDPEILSLLDDPESSQREIEDLKLKLGPDLFNYLFSIANSAYHGSLKLGQVRHFYDVVSRLGMQHTKAAVLMFAMHRLARGEADTELIYVKSFAASVVGRILTRGLGFSDDAARKVELGCLFFSFGLLMMMVYRNHHQDEAFHVDDDFIEKFQSLLTQRIISRFRLPDYLLEMVSARCFSLDLMNVNLSGVVQMGMAVVEHSFRKFDNQLVIQSPPQSSGDGLSITLGAIIKDQFDAAGLRKYLRMVTPLPGHAEQDKELPSL